jgi:drug/metabolite transporter (DMT)-like permease
MEAGALLALGAALLIGLELIFIKRLSGANRRFRSCSSAIPSASSSPRSRSSGSGKRRPRQWAGMAALGLTMAAAQFCFVNSMARADASFVTPFTYLTLVFAALYDAGALRGLCPMPSACSAPPSSSRGPRFWREAGGHGRAKASPIPR